LKSAFEAYQRVIQPLCFLSAFFATDNHCVLWLNNTSYSKIV